MEGLPVTRQQSSQISQKLGFAGKNALARDRTIARIPCAKWIDS